MNDATVQSTSVFKLGDLAIEGPSGVVWSEVSEQLNLNLVKLDARAEIGEHVNDEVDVAMIVVSGSGEIEVDGDTQCFGTDDVVMAHRGALRSVRAHTRLLYYTVHVRRDGPSIAASKAVQSRAIAENDGRDRSWNGNSHRLQRR